MSFWTRSVALLIVVVLVAILLNASANSWALNSWRSKSVRNQWQDWTQEVAVVTGGSGGIGAMVVAQLCELGVKVAILDILEPHESVKTCTGKLEYVPCDLTSRKSIAEAAEIVRTNFGPPSILINNAGVARPDTIIAPSNPDQWQWLDTLFKVNLISNFATVNEFVPHMIAANKGHVISVASMASFVTVAGFADYCCSKAGLLAFHEGLTQELKHNYNAPNVLTTSVHPFWVRTPLIEPFATSLDKSGTSILSPQQVANAIVRQISSCTGGQIVLPNHYRYHVVGIRAWPNWLQELLRDSLKGAVNL